MAKAKRNTSRHLSRVSGSKVDDDIRKPCDPSATQRDAIAQIFLDHNETLVLFLRAKLASMQEAQEVAQEAYIRMLRRDDPDAIRHLRAYLFKTASNIAIDRVRKSQRSPDFEGLGDVIESFPGTEAAPDKCLVDRQRLARLQNLIDQLPTKCRMAFVMHRIDEMAYTDIAARMGLTESMVRKYVQRAIVYCKTHLDDPQPDEAEDTNGNEND